jgi:hypothetical protein
MAMSERAVNAATERNQQVRLIFRLSAYDHLSDPLNLDRCGIAVVSRCSCVGSDSPATQRKISRYKWGMRQPIIKRTSMINSILQIDLWIDVWTAQPIDQFRRTSSLREISVKMPARAARD